MGDRNAGSLEVNVMVKWCLPTLGEIIESTESDLMRQSRQQYAQSRTFQEQVAQQWYGAIAALNKILASQIQFQHDESEWSSSQGISGSIDVDATSDATSDAISNTVAVANNQSSSGRDGPMVIDGDCVDGLVLSGPFPVLDQLNASPRLAQWTLTNDPSQRVMPRQLPSAEAFSQAIASGTTIKGEDRKESEITVPTLSLHPDDPLGVEPFCLVLTSTFSAVLTLSLDYQTNPHCFISFDPAIVWQSWQALRSRLKVTHSGLLPTMDAIAHQFAPPTPDYQVVAEFHQLMLLHVAEAQQQRVNASSSLPRERLRRQVTLSAERDRRGDRSSTHSSVSRQTSGFDTTAAAGQEGESNYSRKPLNLNRVERLKLGDVSWQEVVATNPRLTDRTHGSGPNNPNNVDNVAANGDRAQSRQPNNAHVAQSSGNEVPQPAIGSDVELLKAIAHEVRTPLTTIRTLTRLLLKAKSMDAKVMKRLQQIDRECTKQIDRFGLIFKAVELKTAATDRPASPLATISLQQMVQQNVDRWQQQAQQRNLTLDVILPQSLPNVMSDPTTLDQVLTGLMDRMTHTLPAGTLIQLSVVPAGHQIKLQFWARPRSHASTANDMMTSSNTVGGEHSAGISANGQRKMAVSPDGTPSIFAPSLQAVGELLMFQPETGNLSLNLDITKNLFQSLGGKLIVRQTPQRGEVLTIFLPLEHHPSTKLSPSVLKGKRFC